MSNPFQLVYDKLWNIVEANPQLVRHIPVGNRIKYTENVDKLQNYSDADVPELALISGGYKKLGNSTQCTTFLSKKYIWATTVGSLIISDFNMISWELFRALENHRSLMELQWCGCPFVSNFQLIDVQEGNEMLTKDVGIDGWAAYAVCEVEMQFSVSKLRLS